LDSFINGYNMNDGIFNSKPPKPCSWNGVQFASVRAAARALGVSSELMSWRIRRGYTSDEDLLTVAESKAVVWNNK
jgi:hypothetical protein